LGILSVRNLQTVSAIHNSFAKKKTISISGENGISIASVSFYFDIHIFIAIETISENVLFTLSHVYGRRVL
jgi:hypothetical protein